MFMNKHFYKLHLPRTKYPLNHMYALILNEIRKTKALNLMCEKTQKFLTIILRYLN